ncbi:hypothetical protein [Streptomyces sp. R41]|uniref:Uncharacterized protein n=1 Tax=Streptomyces sp. R41 TaxID=3238632 RepID=A0AB39R747_9ACTN
MKAPLPDSTHVTDEAVARIDPLWWSWEGAHGGHAAALDGARAELETSPADVARHVLDAIEAGREEVLAGDITRQAKAALSGGAPDGV